MEGLLDALGDAGGALVVAAVEQDGELVAAEARGQVAGAQHPAQAAGEGDEQLVADLVAEAVVDPLEVVEVEEEHDRAAVGRASAASTCWVNSARLASPVERVVRRAVLEAVAVLGQLPQRLLEPVVLERDRGVVGERLQQGQIGGGELGDAALAVGKRDPPDQALLAGQRGEQQLAATVRGVADGAGPNLARPRRAARRRAGCRPAPSGRRRRPG